MAAWHSPQVSITTRLKSASVSGSRMWCGLWHVVHVAGSRPTAFLSGAWRAVVPCTLWRYFLRIPAWHVPHVALTLSGWTGEAGSFTPTTLCPPWQVTHVAATTSPDLSSALLWVSSV